MPLTAVTPNLKNLSPSPDLKKFFAWMAHIDIIFNPSWMAQIHIRLKPSKSNPFTGPCSSPTLPLKLYRSLMDPGAQVSIPGTFLAFFLLRCLLHPLSPTVHPLLLFPHRQQSLPPTTPSYCLSCVCSSPVPAWATAVAPHCPHCLVYAACTLQPGPLPSASPVDLQSFPGSQQRQEQPVWPRAPPRDSTISGEPSELMNC